MLSRQRCFECLHVLHACAEVQSAGRGEAGWKCKLAVESQKCWGELEERWALLQMTQSDLKHHEVQGISGDSSHQADSSLVRFSEASCFSIHW